MSEATHEHTHTHTHGEFHCVCGEDFATAEQLKQHAAEQHAPKKA